MIRQKLVKVVITGPESTGKTTLAEELARNFHAALVPEYAREHVENLGRPYKKEDVEFIARKQVELEKQFSQTENPILFLDTWLIITKVWFEQVYGEAPGWLIDQIRASSIDLFLLCDTSLPWMPDTVRENGGEKREELFSIYRQNLESFGFTYKIISGTGTSRLHAAQEFTRALLY